MRFLYDDFRNSNYVRGKEYFPAIEALFEKPLLIFFSFDPWDALKNKTFLSLSHDCYSQEKVPLNSRFKLKRVCSAGVGQYIIVCDYVHKMHMHDKLIIIERYFKNIQRLRQRYIEEDLYHNTVDIQTQLEEVFNKFLQPPYKLLMKEVRKQTIGEPISLYLDEQQGLIFDILDEQPQKSLFKSGLQSRLRVQLFLGYPQKSKAECTYKIEVKYIQVNTLTNLIDVNFSIDMFYKGSTFQSIVNAFFKELLVLKQFQPFFRN